MIRQVQIYCILGLTEAVIDTTSRMDIKGVQFDTIGFTFLRSFLEIGSTHDSFSSKLSPALNFYSENLKDSKKNLVTSLKQKTVEPINQFYRFEIWIKSSYMWLVYLFSQKIIMKNQSGISDSSKRQNSEWFDGFLEQALAHKQDLIQTEKDHVYESPKDYQVWNGKQPTLSISADLLQSIYVRDTPESLRIKEVPVRCDYLGLYQNPRVLQYQQLVSKLENRLKDESHNLQEVEKIAHLLEDLDKQISLESVLDFGTHFQSHKEQTQLLRPNMDTLQTSELQDQFLFFKDTAAFIASETLLYINVKAFSQDKLQQYIDSLSRSEKNWQVIMDKLNLHVSNFDALKNGVPINLFKKLYLFLGDFVSIVQALVELSLNLKSKMFEAQKKEKNDDSKKKINEFSKQWSNHFTQINQQIGTFLKHSSSMLKSNQNYSFVRKSLNLIVEEYPQLAKVQSFDLNKTVSEFEENLYNNFKFQNIRFLSYLEEKVKLFK